MPLTAVVIIEADALQIAHDSPSNAIASTASFATFTSSSSRSPHSGFTPFGLMRRVGERAPVPRLAVVVEDHFLIELSGICHAVAPQRKYSCCDTRRQFTEDLLHLAIAATSASTSSIVL